MNSNEEKAKKKEEKRSTWTFKRKASKAVNRMLLWRSSGISVERIWKNLKISIGYFAFLDFNLTNFQAIQKQKKSFRQIIAKKEELIKRLEEDIESKDEDYLNLLKRNKEDIRVIINSMHTQYYNMRRIYLDELDLIEDQFMKARAAQIKANKNDIKIWIEKHESSERQFINNRWNNEKEQEKEINDLRIKNSQDYVLLKKQIETDIQNLQQC